MLLRGQDFHSEKAIISIELYRKGVWRFAAVANGFNGGLGDLLRSYGGEELTAPPQPAPQKTEKISLKKGQKVSLSKNSGTPIIIENGWTAAGKDYDLKALVRYRSGKLVYVGASNSDEVMSTPEGAIRHGGDVTAPGELEHINIVWHPDIASVAVSSYSAIENGTGSFYRYGVFVRIRNGNQTIEIPAANTSANDKSYTLCFGGDPVRRKTGRDGSFRTGIVQRPRIRAAGWVCKRYGADGCWPVRTEKKLTRFRGEMTYGRDSETF